ncbi:MAG: hypothetical protein JSV65_00195 [Armatimonadota bacterium]|nr:MAG: hypothetical protein JSV65_00195 [Armatimonadota bacterium]
MIGRLLASLVLAASLLSSAVGANKVMLRWPAPETPLQYDAEFALSGSLRVAPGAEVAHPYVGETDIRAGGTARLSVEFGGDAADRASVTFVLRSAEAFVQAFNSRLDLKLTSDENGATATVSVNDVQLSSERLDRVPRWQPPSATAGDTGASAGVEAVRVLQLILWDALVAVGDLPDVPVAPGEEWTRALVLPSAGAAASIAPLIDASVTHRLAVVDETAGSATVEFSGEFSPVPGRAAFRMPLTVPSGAAPLEVSVELEHAGGKASGSMAIPLQDGFPLAARGVVDVKLRAWLRSDDPDWQGRAVAVEAEGRLNYAVRRSGE